MQIDETTRVLQLLEAHPELEPVLVDLHPLFKGLRSTFLRKTMGRKATLGMAAGMAGIPVAELLDTVRGALGRAASDEAPAAAKGAPAAPPQREVLKGILKDLHAGVAQEEIQRRFNAFAQDMDVKDIAAVERELVAEGTSEAEIKGLCDVHARMMGGALPPEERTLQPGHPGHTLKAENAALEEVAVRLEEHLSGLPDPASLAAFREDLERFGAFELHYQRTEYQVFPFLEKHDITAPPQVMWAVHDDIRGQLKAVSAALDAGEPEALPEAVATLLHSFREMVFKEERILIPLCLDTFSDAEWAEIRDGEADIGYALVEPGTEWSPAPATVPAEAPAQVSDGARRLPLDTGMLNLPQINMMLTRLPVDITFVNEHDKVAYYSDGPERVFPRSPGIIGREVANCHPPKSVHIVQEILDAFRAGRQEVAEFWLELNGRFLHIRYFAMRDPLGKYRGCLEVTQDVTRIRALEGQRRLLQWSEEKTDV